MQNLRTAMGRNVQAGQEPRWNEVRAEFLSATSGPLRPEIERLLLDILKFEGELQLDESSEMPHRMSPENMLKSLAVQALARWTDAYYLPTMRRIEATAPAALSCVIRAVIHKVGTHSRGKPRSTGIVTPPPCEEPARMVHVVHNDILQDAIDEWEQKCGYRTEIETFLLDFGMTYMPGDRLIRQRQEAQKVRPQ